MGEPVWEKDPTGRHPYREYNAGWTDKVSEHPSGSGAGTDPEGRTLAMYPSGMPSRRTKVVWWSVGIVGTVCLVGFLALANRGPERIHPETTTAAIMCEKFIAARLVAPATADYDHQSATQDGDEWTVRGSVDSENRLGVPLRNRYQCDVTHVAGSGRWELVDLTLI